MSLEKYADPNYKPEPKKFDFLDKFIKIMGEENLTVVRGPFPTASMDPENRVIYMTDFFLEDPHAAILAASHEVAHAKHTPRDWGHQAIKGKKLSMRYKQALNIVEDIRIERLIRNEYPGLVRDFKKGYQWMIENGFFGDQKKLSEDSSELRFSDIVNMRSKLGEDCLVDFNSNRDLAAYRYIRSAETFDEVAERARFMMLYEEHKDEEEEQGQQEQDGDGKGEPSAQSAKTLGELINKAKEDPSKRPELFQDDDEDSENKMSKTYEEYEKKMGEAAAKGQQGSPMVFNKGYKPRTPNVQKIARKIFG